MPSSAPCGVPRTGQDTMILLPLSPSESDVFAVVGHWLDLLAADDFYSAFALTAQDEAAGWTPELMRRVIRGYGLVDDPKHDCKVTSRDRALGSPEREMNMWTPIARPAGHCAIGWVAHSIPLDGKWSDLSVTFEICKRESHCFLELDEIHVF